MIQFLPRNFLLMNFEFDENFMLTKNQALMIFEEKIQYYEIYFKKAVLK
jgi:hypothetical protein